MKRIRGTARAAAAALGLLAGAAALVAKRPPEPAPGLAGTSWRLVRFQGGDDRVLTPADPTKYTVEFGKDGALAVRIDCNRGRGTWTAPEPGRLEFGPLAMTKVGCPPAPLTERLSKDWGYVRSYVLRGGHLFLALMADAGIYEFEPVPAPPPASCAAPEYRQFDFWLGDWDVRDEGDEKPSMRIVVEKVLDGCVLRETYRDVHGLVGESVSVYDASRRLWHQTWVTNRGQLLVLEGGIENGRMVLRATETTQDGPVLWRAFWSPQGAEVRETAETSSDGGRTWKPKFDIVFRRHEGA